MELSCFYDDTADVGNLISDSSAFSKSSLNIWKFMSHVLLKLGLENIEYYLASMWDEYSCAVVWALFGIAFLWDWNELVCYRYWIVACVVPISLSLSSHFLFFLTVFLSLHSYHSPSVLPFLDCYVIQALIFGFHILRHLILEMLKQILRSECQLIKMQLYRLLRVHVLGSDFWKLKFWQKKLALLGKKSWYPS